MISDACWRKDDLQQALGDWSKPVVSTSIDLSTLAPISHRDQVTICAGAGLSMLTRSDSHLADTDTDAGARPWSVRVHVEKGLNDGCCPMGAAFGQPARIVAAALYSSAGIARLLAGPPAFRTTRALPPGNVRAPLLAAGRQTVRAVTGLAEKSETPSASSSTSR